ncbi:MAG TPA: zinc dependent phospholipase C family protein [Polyangia bacterium]|nr:zinc dependent phospholipase C family protein [Polyangia bacterium]
MLLCQCAADPAEATRLGLPQLPGQLYTLFNNQDSFLCLGAVTPDLPAVSDVLWKEQWSDAMHSGHLRQLVVQVFDELVANNASDASLAWVFGYVGHIVADVGIHPVVGLANAARGGNAHRECEIVQDTRLYREKTGGDLIHSPCLDGVKGCRKDPQAIAEIMTAWATCLKKVDPAFDGSCIEWYGVYLSGIHGAVTLIPQKVPPPLVPTAHKYLANYAYQSEKDIDAKDNADFYDGIVLPLPGAPRGTFLYDACDRVLQHLIPLWNSMWQAKQTKTSLAGLIPDWNLNTGMDSTTGKLAFWP